MATVLLIGERSQVLDELEEIVVGNNHFVVRAESFSELDRMDMTHTDVVTFGQALTEQQITALQSTYRQKNPHIIFVRSLAPIPSLLAIQINAALTVPQAGRVIPAYDRPSHMATITLLQKQPVRVTVWWLSIFFHPKAKVILEKVLDPGQHNVSMPTWARGAKYYVTVEIGKQDAYIV